MENKLYLTNAYRIFFTEMEKHLGRAEEQFIALESCDADQRKRLSMAFHTIKGGSGFFALSEVMALASSLEKLFQNPELTAEHCKEARESLQKLSALYRELPKPEEQAHA